MPKSLYDILTAAMADVARNGYQSQAQIDDWADQIRKAAEREMGTQADIDRMVQEALNAIYRREVLKGGVLKLNPGVSAYTLEKIKPELRAELRRRIAASADLIKVNRPQAIAKTEQRFRGWATSVPKGGSDTVKVRRQKREIRKSLGQLPFEERRVIIDQGHKLVANINDTVAIGGGAIGATWWATGPHQPGYDGRPAHDKLNDEFFLLKGSWADQAGYVKLAGHQWTDDVVQPSVEPFCRCSWIWKYSLRSIPSECLTQKGAAALADARAKARAA